MDRRSFLSALGVCGVGALAGCAGVRAPGSTSAPADAPADVGAGLENAETTPPASADPATTPTLAALGTPATICDADILSEFHIRAVVDPAFAPDWTGVEVDRKYRVASESDPTTADGGLSADATVVGLEREGDARAYPLSVLWWHEIVNDDFHGPVLVTYCPICRSGMVAERRVAGEPTVFHVSGQLWRPPGEFVTGSVASDVTFGATTDDPDATVRNGGNLVLYDESTRSYWSQILARAICGAETGTRLSLVPSAVTTWSEWRREHPETDVLLPPPHSKIA